MIFFGMSDLAVGGLVVVLGLFLGLILAISNTLQHLMGVGIMNPLKFAEWMKGIKAEVTGEIGCKSSQADKVAAMKIIFSHFFAEDKIDGTSFDVKVLEALDSVVKEK